MMNHAITVGGLLGFFGGIVGIILLGAGVVTFFAGAMSDAPAEGDSAGRSGCILSLVGVAVIVGCTAMGLLT